jgi:adenine-specific DNA-methyltransferase
VDATVHRNAKRTNIPTAELERFAEDDERKPSKVMYKRDTALDPQLVWKGKDEQDAEPLILDAVPISIQEKIHPRALIDELRAESRRAEPQHQIDLFGDFNGLEFEQLVDFYQHSMRWQNRLILGDSLLVMASLAEKEGLRGKVQMVYMDPPYGIDFRSNWQVSTRSRDIRDGRGEDASRQPEQVKAFRDTWHLGVHSYLSYLRDRLVLAHDLLSPTGSIFVQIGEDNVHRARALLDEVFGWTSHVVTILVKKKGGQRSGYIDPVNDYILWYSKLPRGDSDGGPKYRQLFEPRSLDAETLSEFKNVELSDKSVHPISAVPAPNGDGTIDYRLRPRQLAVDHPGARLFASNPLTGGGVFRTQAVPYEFGGTRFAPGRGQSWKHSAITDDGSPSGMDRLAMAGRLVAGDNTWRFKRYLDDFPYKSFSNWWDGLGGASQPTYAVQTNLEIVKRCLLMTTDPGDLVLDPTCGSGTTAVAAEQWGRRWITIDTSRVALALTRTRLMASRHPYYLLADSSSGIKKAAELSGRVPDASVVPTNDVSKGFVYATAPHITSTDIATNRELQLGMAEAEIAAAVARNTPSETLFDRPFEDGSVVRVSGPFTVESLSPHRYRDPAEPGADSGDRGRAAFIDRILENLRRAGVQNTVKGERLVFDQLEVWPGNGYVQAAGEYFEAGTRRRAAVCIGPEFGTVGSELVREAAKEALHFADLLVVCAYAFDAHVGEDATKLGRLTVLKARMNPDMSMADDLLKKTASANLFMVFGEPDVRIESVGADHFTAEIRGLDTYNPTTGEIRSDSTEDIACWFIDTDYNDEGFFVRHAYFLGADDPYNKLKRVLRADIAEDTWATMYSAKSRPFPRPSSGKIAIKVINHFGDEVLKSYVVPD